MTLHVESEALESQGRLVEAEACCREALQLFVEGDGDDSLDVANLLNSLANLLAGNGKYVEAEQCARRALAIVEPLVARTHHNTARAILVHALEQLGSALREQGRYADAEPPLRLAIAEASHADPQLRIGALNHFGVLCKFAAKFEEGAHAYKQALDLAIAQFGSRHPMVATLYHNIGGLEHARGRFAAAEHPAREAWEIRRQLYGENNPETAADAAALAAILYELNRRREARELLEQALQVFQTSYGEDHYEVAVTLHNLAALEQAEGHAAVAERLYRRSLLLKETLLGPDHPDTALTMASLGALTNDTRLLGRAVAVCERTLVARHPHLIACREAYSSACRSEPAGSFA